MLFTVLHFSAIGMLGADNYIFGIRHSRTLSLKGDTCMSVSHSAKVNKNISQGYSQDWDYS